MKHRTINYSINGYFSDLTIEIVLSEKVKISDEAVNKSLMIAMNYLIENMETEETESAE
jgi:hypothetical protein